MTQRKISQAVVAGDSHRRAATAHGQYLTHFQETLLEGSTPGPLKFRSDADPRQAIDRMDERRNHLRVWSYKGVGI
jgi:hypothetical protein